MKSCLMVQGLQQLTGNEEHQVGNYSSCWWAAMSRNKLPGFAPIKTVGIEEYRVGEELGT